MVDLRAALIFGSSLLSFGKEASSILVISLKYIIYFIILGHDK